MANYIDREIIGKTIADVIEGYERVAIKDGHIRVMTKRIIFTDGTTAVVTLESDCDDYYSALRMENK